MSEKAIKQVSRKTFKIYQGNITGVQHATLLRGKCFNLIGATK